MKKQLLFGAAALIAMGVSAAPLTPEEALSRIDGGMMKASGLNSLKGATLSYTAKTEAGNPAAYVFNKGHNGYLVVSGDDLAYPVLGYADKGNFDAENMPPQMKWWLGEYARQIAYATEHGAKQDKESARKVAKVNGEAIAPQIKTKWDQVEPYNNMCPLYGAARTYTGCVATAMAQVMNYWKYPEVGKGKISYDSQSLGKRLSLDFSKRKFDWANMIDTYLPGQYTEAQADAVAYLMKAAGYSVKMDYAQDSSGALAMNIANGLRKYFNYDSNIFYTLREYYSATQWAQMIYDNLKNVGPLLYGGGSMLGGGHSFVCDGYDGNGYFHFNWGWSGMSDGYFSLDALNPSSLGSGGGGGGGYNFTQDAVFGIQPPTGKPTEERPLAITQMGSLFGQISGSTLAFGLFVQEGAAWVNYNPTGMKVQFGAIIEPLGETQGEKKFTLISNKRYNIVPGYGADPTTMKPQVNLNDLNLADGKYKFTIATIALEEENAQPVPVLYPYSCYNYVIVEKKGDTYSISVEDVFTLDLKSGEIVGDLYAGCLATVKISLENTADLELTKGFAPVLIYNGSIYYLGESIFVTLKPGEKMTREWVTSFTATQSQVPSTNKDTEFYLTFFDEGTYNTYDNSVYKKVVMKARPSTPQVTVTSAPVIKGAEVKKVKISGRTYDVYQVENRMDIPVESNLMLKKGYFSYNVMACVVPLVTSGDGQVAVLTYGSSPMMLTVGEETKFSTNLGFATAEQDKYYQLVMAYEVQGGLAALSTPTSIFQLADLSGVEEIEDETLNEAADNRIFNLQGVYVGNDLESLPSGIYIVNGKKVRK